MDQIWPAKPTGATFACLISFRCSWTRLPRSKKPSLSSLPAYAPGFRFSGANLGPCSREPWERIAIPSLSLTHHGTAMCRLVVVPGDATIPGGRAKRRSQRWARSPKVAPALAAAGPGWSKLHRARARGSGGWGRSSHALAPTHGSGGARGWSSPALMLAPAHDGRGRAPPRPCSHRRQTGAELPRARARARRRWSGRAPPSPCSRRRRSGGGAPSRDDAIRQRRRGRSSPARPSSCSMQCQKGRTKGNFTPLLIQGHPTHFCPKSNTILN
jgi:hypothetical protein